MLPNSRALRVVVALILLVAAPFAIQSSQEASAVASPATQSVFWLGGTTAAGGDGTSATRAWSKLSEVRLPADRPVILNVIGRVVGDQQLVLPQDCIVQGSNGATIDGEFRDIRGLLRVNNPARVEFRNIKLANAVHGVYVDGAVGVCVFESCWAERMIGFGAYTHEDTNTAEGEIEFRNCVAKWCEGDGFSNRWNGKATLRNCHAAHCGPIWSTYQLDHSIAGLQDSMPYADFTAVNQVRPKITRTIYVSASSGADANSGLSPGAALASLAAAQALIQPGDRIALKRGDQWTSGTLTLVNDTEVTSYGTGRMPQLIGARNPIACAGAARVWINSVHFKDSTPGVLVSGTVANVWITGNEFNQCDTYAVSAVDAAGAGDVSFFGNSYHFNNGGDVRFEAGAYVVRAWSEKSVDAAISAPAGTAASWYIGGACVGKLRNLKIDEPRNTGIALNTSSTDNLIDGCWVNDVQASAGATSTHGVFTFGASAGQIINSTLTCQEPAAGITSIGVGLQGTGVVDVFNNTFQGLRNSGGAGEVLLDVAAAIPDVRILNNVFENRNNSAGSLYMRLAGSPVRQNSIGFDVNRLRVEYNLYRDASGTGNPTKWNVNGGDLDVLGWIAVAGVDEDLSHPDQVNYPGGFRSGLVQINLTKNWPALNYGHDARIEDEAAIAAFHYFGLDLAKAGLTDVKHDIGLRTRGENPTRGWMPGSCVNYTGSPDGYTTHQNSSMRLEGCSAVWCQNGVDFTHDQLTTADDMGLFGCEFWHCFNGGVEQAITRAFPIHDCIFVGGTDNAIDINAPASADGDVWDIDGCYFWGCEAQATCQVRSVGASITVNFRNCIFVGPRSTWSEPTLDCDELLRLSSGTNTINVQNCVFWLPHQRNMLRTTYGIRGQSSDPSLNVHNSMFFGPDETNAKYIRAANAAQLVEADGNFYHQGATATDRWQVGSALDFAGWQALNKGSGGAATDNSGQHSALRHTGRPDTGDERNVGPHRFRLVETSPLRTSALNRGAANARTWAGGMRPASGGWPVGPFVDPTTSAVRRSGDRLVLNRATLSASFGRDLPLFQNAGNRSSVGGRAMVIDRVELVSPSATPIYARIHRGPYAKGDLLWAGIVGVSGETLRSGPVECLESDDVRLSFDEQSGEVSGFLTWYAREKRGATKTTPEGIIR